MTGLLSVVEAAALLRRGGLVAYPTEAVWGLGCDPFDEAAVSRLLVLKQRAVDKGVILVAASMPQLDGLVDWRALPQERRDAVLATWIVPATVRVPRWITGVHDGNVAVRISAHAVVAALCEAFGAPLVSTSANRASMPPPRDVAAIDAKLLSALDGIVEGVTGDLAQPTPIRDARSGYVLRS